MLQEKLDLLRNEIKITETNLNILKRFYEVIFKLYQQNRTQEVHRLFELLEKELDK